MLPVSVDVQLFSLLDPGSFLLFNLRTADPWLILSPSDSLFYRLSIELIWNLAVAIVKH